MARLFSLALLTLLASSALCAQNLGSAAPPEGSQQGVVEMKILRTLSPETNGVADLLPGVKADKLILHYTLQNTGTHDVRIADVAIAEQVNCHAAIARQPEPEVAANGETTMVLEVSRREQGLFSFTVNMTVDGREYSFPVQATVTALLDHEHDHHHDDDHHCSTGVGGSWLLLGGVAALLGTLMFRRRAA
jgi:hypothetical protein